MDFTDMFLFGDHPHAVGDIGEIAQCGGKMAFENIRIKVANLTATHRFDKISLMPPAVITDKLFDNLFFMVIGSSAAHSAGKVSIFTFYHHSHPNTSIMI